MCFWIWQLLRCDGGFGMKSLPNWMQWSRCEVPGGLCVGVDTKWPVRQRLSHLHMQTARSKTKRSNGITSDTNVCGYRELQIMEHLLLCWLLGGQDVYKERSYCSDGKNTDCSQCWGKKQESYPDLLCFLSLMWWFTFLYNIVSIYPPVLYH